MTTKFVDERYTPYCLTALYKYTTSPRQGTTISIFYTTIDKTPDEIKSGSYYGRRNKMKDKLKYAIGKGVICFNTITKEIISETIIPKKFNLACYTPNNPFILISDNKTLKVFRLYDSGSNSN